MATFNPNTVSVGQIRASGAQNLSAYVAQQQAKGNVAQTGNAAWDSYYSKSASASSGGSSQPSQAQPQVQRIIETQPVYGTIFDANAYNEYANKKIADFQTQLSTKQSEVQNELNKKAAETQAAFDARHMLIARLEGGSAVSQVVDRQRYAELASKENALAQVFTKQYNDFYESGRTAVNADLESSKSSQQFQKQGIIGYQTVEKVITTMPAPAAKPVQIQPAKTVNGVTSLLTPKADAIVSPIRQLQIVDTKTGKVIQEDKIIGYTPGGIVQNGVGVGLTSVEYNPKGFKPFIITPAQQAQGITPAMITLQPLDTVETKGISKEFTASMLFNAATSIPTYSPAYIDTQSLIGKNAGLGFQQRAEAIGALMTAAGTPQFKKQVEADIWLQTSAPTTEDIQFLAMPKVQAANIAKAQAEQLYTKYQTSQKPEDYDAYVKAVNKANEAVATANNFQVQLNPSTSYNKVYKESTPAEIAAARLFGQPSAMEVAVTPAQKAIAQHGLGFVLPNGDVLGIPPLGALQRGYEIGAFPFGFGGGYDTNLKGTETNPYTGAILSRADLVKSLQFQSELEYAQAKNAPYGTQELGSDLMKVGMYGGSGFVFGGLGGGAPGAIVGTAAGLVGGTVDALTTNYVYHLTGQKSIGEASGMAVGIPATIVAQAGITKAVTSFAPQSDLAKALTPKIKSMNVDVQKQQAQEYLDVDQQFKVSYPRDYQRVNVVYELPSGKTVSKDFDIFSQGITGTKQVDPLFVGGLQGGTTPPSTALQEFGQVAGFKSEGAFTLRLTPAKSIYTGSYEDIFTGQNQIVQPKGFFQNLKATLFGEKYQTTSFFDDYYTQQRVLSQAKVVTKGGTFNMESGIQEYFNPANESLGYHAYTLSAMDDTYVAKVALGQNREAILYGTNFNFAKGDNLASIERTLGNQTDDFLSLGEKGYVNFGGQHVESQRVMDLLAKENVQKVNFMDVHKLGEYNPATGVIKINKGLNVEGASEVGMHEFGHRLIANLPPEKLPSLEQTLSDFKTLAVENLGERKGTALAFDQARQLTHYNIDYKQGEALARLVEKFPEEFSMPTTTSGKFISGRLGYYENTVLPKMLGAQPMADLSYSRTSSGLMMAQITRGGGLGLQTIYQDLATIKSPSPLAAINIRPISVTQTEAFDALRGSLIQESLSQNAFNSMLATQAGYSSATIGALRFGTGFGFGTAPKAETVTKTAMLEALQPMQREGTMERIMNITSTKPIETTATIEAINTRTALLEVQATATREATLTRQELQYPEMTLPRATTQTITPPGSVLIPINFGGNQKRETVANRRKNMIGYNVYLRRQGRNIKVNQLALPKNLAIRYGEEATRKSLARSFFLEAVGETNVPDIPFASLRGYRGKKKTSKIKENVFIQINPLETGAEKQQIKQARRESKNAAGFLKKLMLR